MMRFGNVLAAFLLLSAVLYGQGAKTLPKLPDDKAVETGMLPDGVKYYLVSDKSSAGMCSFALVRKEDASTEVDDLYRISGRMFASVGFGDVSLDGFLGRNGIFPSEKGYIECRRGSVIYTFGGYSSARGEAVLDTVLLSIFNLAQAAAAEGRPSSSQAVIVAGDFDRALLLSKMKTLCLVNPFVPGDAPSAPVPAGPSSADRGPVTEGRAAARVTVRWQVALTPFEYMNTVLPVISDKMTSELVRVIRGRLFRAYEAENLDVWMDVSRPCPGEGTLEISIGCPGSRAQKVREILCRELDRLYTYGAGCDEYAYAREGVRYGWLSSSRDLRPSADRHIARCADSFLYGASLANDTERIRFAYRDLPDSVQTRLFNNYMRSVLGRTAKADSTLAAVSDPAGRDAVGEILRSGRVSKPLKAPKDKEEYVTGGLMWTFSNGVNVICRQMPSKGMVYFSYAAKGGRQYASGEDFRTVDGVAPWTFSDYLDSFGIELRTVLNPADIRLEGKVPVENMERMLEVLEAVTDRDSNRKAFGQDSYKLLILAGDLDPDKVRKMLCAHVPLLRQGSKWKAVKYTGPAAADLDEARLHTMSDITFPYDVTAFNNAVSAVASYALSDMLGRTFSSYGVCFLMRGGYVGFPLNEYRMIYGVRNVPLEHFSPVRTRLGEDAALAAVRSVIGSLASSETDASSLKVYRTLAKNEFASRSAMPQHYIDMAMERYLDNKDLTYRFNSQVDAVTARDIQEFYAAAASADR